MIEQLETSLLQIYSIDRQVLDAGFLLPKQPVLACAQVRDLDPAVLHDVVHVIDPQPNLGYNRAALETDKTMHRRLQLSGELVDGRIKRAERYPT